MDENQTRSRLGVPIRLVVVLILAAALAFGLIALGAQIMQPAIDRSAIDESEKVVDRMTGAATEELLRTDVDVVVGDYSLSKGSYDIISSCLQVTVVNKAPSVKTYNIQLEAIDQQGNRIDADYLYARMLAPGQSQEFETFKYIPDENYEKMKTARFRVVTVSQY